MQYPLPCNTPYLATDLDELFHKQLYPQNPTLILTLYL